MENLYFDVKDYEKLTEALDYALQAMHIRKDGITIKKEGNHTIIEIHKTQRTDFIALWFMQFGKLLSK